MSTISASTTSTTGYVVTSDTTGTLVLQTGATPTTAVTVASNQQVTFAQPANLPNTFGFKNRIINGAMVIDQRNAGASVTATSGGGYFYSTDRWITYNLVGVNFTTQRVTDAPTGFVNSTRLTFANAFSLTSTGEATFQQVIEGFNVADLGWGTAGASSIAVSFWAKASFTGTFSVGVCNGTGTRAYATTYTINAADTWEYKTVTIPGDTSGTWATDNTQGLFLRFMLASGSNFVVSSNNAWTTRAGAYNAADSVYGTRAIGAATSISAGATWQITGVQLEAGSTATSFDFRDYGRELMLCQRYAVLLGTTSGGYTITIGRGMSNGGSAGWRTMLQVPYPMRATPSLTAVNLLGWNIGGAVAFSSFGTVYLINGLCLEADINYASSVGAASTQVYLQTNGSGGASYLLVSAEL
jgi:hypothetical protein